MEIEWEDILQDDSGKGIFEMELEDLEETLDDADQDGDEVCFFQIKHLPVAILHPL